MKVLLEAARRADQVGTQQMEQMRIQLNTAVTELERLRNIDLQRAGQQHRRRINLIGESVPPLQPRSSVQGFVVPMRDVVEPPRVIPQAEGKEVVRRQRTPPAPIGRLAGPDVPVPRLEPRSLPGTPFASPPESREASPESPRRRLAIARAVPAEFPAVSVRSLRFQNPLQMPLFQRGGQPEDKKQVFPTETSRQDRLWRNYRPRPQKMSDRFVRIFAKRAAASILLENKVATMTPEKKTALENSFFVAFRKKIPKSSVQFNLQMSQPQPKKSLKDNFGIEFKNPIKLGRFSVIGGGDDLQDVTFNILMASQMATAGKHAVSDDPDDYMRNWSEDKQFPDNDSMLSFVDLVPLERLV